MTIIVTAVSELVVRVIACKDINDGQLMNGIHDNIGSAFTNY